MFKFNLPQTSGLDYPSAAAPFSICPPFTYVFKQKASPVLDHA
jgi:hypothetical protein